MGFDMYILKLPVFGALVEKNILARTTRTLGTLISSGVPILEALNITRETAGNALFERIFTKVIEAIREGEVICKPMRDHSTPGFHPLALFFWMLMGSFPGVMVLSVALTAGRETAENSMETLTIVGGGIVRSRGCAVRLVLLGEDARSRDRRVGRQHGGRRRGDR